MLLGVIISLLLVALAYGVRSFFVGNMTEFNKQFFLVIAVFMILYISAATFISYKLGAWGAEPSPNTTRSSSNNGYIIQETINEVDLSTPY